MTALRRWFVRSAEKFLDRFYEGPEPPERFGEIVIQFARLYPNATRAEWVRFAAEHAREAYRSGFRRGYEYVERDPDFFRTDMPPEMIADQLDPDWRWRPYDSGIEYPDPNAIPREVPNEYEDAIRFIRESMRRTQEASRSAWERLRGPK